MEQLAFLEEVALTNDFIEGAGSHPESQVVARVRLIPLRDSSSAWPA
jgi:hypothetical protein